MWNFDRTPNASVGWTRFRGTRRLQVAEAAARYRKRTCATFDTRKYKPWLPLPTFTRKARTA
jgi:hypothetical protein